MTTTMTEPIPAPGEPIPLTEDEIDAALSEPTPGEDGTDDAAPYGRRADGTPKRRPGRPRKSDTAPPTTAPKAPSAAPKRRATAAKPAAKASASRESYVQAASDLIAMPAALLTVIGASQGSVALAADGATLELHRVPLANAVADLAEQVPAVGEILTKIATASPYGAFVMAAATIAAQIAANHGAIPAGQLGTMPPADLIAYAASANATA